MKNRIYSLLAIADDLDDDFDDEDFDDENDDIYLPDDEDDVPEEIEQGVVDNGLENDIRRDSGDL